MTEATRQLQELKAGEAAVDERIRAATAKSAPPPPLRRPVDVQRDRRMPKGRTR